MSMPGRKGRADVFVDQMILGYGCNAIEAWGMGIPVIAGVDPEKAPSIIMQTIPLDTRDRMLQLWGDHTLLWNPQKMAYMIALSKMLDKKVYGHSGVRRVWLTSSDSMRPL